MNVEAAYLDAAATAPLRPEAREAMLAVLDAGQANASSVHYAGHRAGAVLQEAREAIAGAMQARQSELIFTSGGTEAVSYTHLDVYKRQADTIAAGAALVDAAAATQLCACLLYTSRCV